MTSRRLLKAAEAIREVVATAILTELRDPRVKNVTVISVEVAPDMREAKVNVSVMGSEKQKANCLSGLQNSAGFLQQQIANRIDSRYTPKLRFVLNKGADNAMVVGELLAKIRQERDGNEPSSVDPVDDDSAQSDAAQNDTAQNATDGDSTAVDSAADDSVVSLEDSWHDDNALETPGDAASDNAKPEAH